MRRDYIDDSLISLPYINESATRYCVDKRVVNVKAALLLFCAYISRRRLHRSIVAASATAQDQPEVNRVYIHQLELFLSSGVLAQVDMKVLRRRDTEFYGL